MSILLVLVSLATIKAFLLGIPESVGLLAFGIGLAIAAGLIRWFLSRGQSSTTEKEVGNKA